MKIPLYETAIILFCLGALVLSAYQFWRGDICGAIFALERQVVLMLLVIFLEIRRVANASKRD